ncbi:MAG TPA: AAC(3) family N-acetyltransferase [Chthonomonadaceae bacterium]|nr:AAC(3) family N-acetyltransferase [Chthonomonadaceae bacterium]
MWSEKQLAEDLRDLGLPAGASVLAHTSLRAIGPIENGPKGLVRAFREALGPEGTLMVPTFTGERRDPAERPAPPETPEALERARAAVPVFDVDASPSDVRNMSVFTEAVRRQSDAMRSAHPTLSFAAIGANAALFTQNVPFHYPLGSESPPARLHQADGWVLLLGVGQGANTSIHLAEIWANVPYIHRNARVKTGPEEWTTMQGSPECSAGFPKIEPVMRQARLLRRGYVGNAPSMLMKQRELVSMAVAMLQGRGDSLLCDNPECYWCALARKYAAETRPFLDA